MRKMLMIGALALTAAVTTGGSSIAQTFEVGPGGVYVGPGYRDRDRDYDRRYERRRDYGVSEGRAVGIARSAGMSRLVRITGGNGRVWRVTGVDRRGSEIRLVIDDQSGRVLSRERE